MKFFVVYVGGDRNIRENLEFGLKNHIWGFKNEITQDIPDENTFFVMANICTCGSPHISKEKWPQFNITNLFIAKITKKIHEESNPLWPDEKEKNTVIYPWRLSFNKCIELQDIKISDFYNSNTFANNDIAEQIRLSATGNGRGILVDIPSLFKEGDKRNKMIDKMIESPNGAMESFDSSIFISDLIKSGLQFAPEFITRFVSSLLTKQFVILTGLTGSGKTKLAEAFSHWIVQDVNKQICMVAVGADWNSRDALLGYPNALKPEEYVKPDNGVLDLLINAQNDQTHPYFLILDEMNMSYVERYFADFLSAMESASKKISLHADWGECDIPAEISLPKNLFIIGTVNIDETTYMFSPKVLDRANVIEFRIAKDAMSAYLANPAHVDIQKLNSNGNLSAESFVDMASQEYMADESYTDVLNNFFTSLADIGAEFGYRTAYEMMRFMAIYKTLDKNAKEDDVLDAAIMQKMLPKVHGSRNRIEPALKKLASLCLNTETADPFADSAEETAKYKLSYDKIKRMHEKLLSEGFTSYAEA
jgi:5-methylcytosine-specific restriction protein B